MVFHISNVRRRFIPLAAILALALFSGCQKAAPPPPVTTTEPAPTPTAPVVAIGPKADVQLVEVFREGDTVRVDPDRVRVKKHTQVVVWAATEGKLKLEWKEKGSPFSRIECHERFCFAITPAETEGTYPYTATVTSAGGAAKADPDVEVVP